MKLRKTREGYIYKDFTKYKNIPPHRRLRLPCHCLLIYSSPVLHLLQLSRGRERRVTTKYKMTVNDVNYLYHCINAGRYAPLYCINRVYSHLPVKLSNRRKSKQIA
jgi:hypothetical protein